MGEYDIAAVMFYISRLTNWWKVAYIGHSQGTTQMFSAISKSYNYYKDLVPIAVMLAPMTKITHSSNELLQYTKKNYVEISDALWLYGIHELLGPFWQTSSAI